LTTSFCFYAVGVFNKLTPIGFLGATDLRTPVLFFGPLLFAVSDAGSEAVGDFPGMAVFLAPEVAPLLSVVAILGFFSSDPISSNGLNKVFAVVDCLFFYIPRK